MVNKMNIKKKIMLLLAVGIMMFAASPFAHAEPQTVQSVTAQTMELTNNKYLTKGGAAFWFIFTIVINGALSFWVGNRFYRLAKKDNHVAAEIRALRRDIDDKFSRSVDGISEQEIEIENLNRIFSMNEEKIAVPKKQSAVKELSPEEEERFRQWEEAQSRPRAEREHVKSNLRNELNEELDDVKMVKRKHYRPMREEAEADTPDFEETRVIKPVSEGVKNKAKEILGDIFPFKDE